MENWLKELAVISAGKAESGVPVYRRLLDAMSQMIADGRIPDGTRLRPDSLLAAELGISHITWAKVLNTLAARGIAERSRKRGTFIRRPHRTNAMKEGKANAVAVFMDDLDPCSCNRIFLETLQKELTAAGFRPAFISAAGSGPIQYSQLVSTMQMNEYCGGLIWSLLDEAQVQSILSLRPPAWPLIFMAADHSIDGEKRHDFIHYDSFSAGAEAARRFIASGGSSFTCLLCESHLFQNCFDRIRGIEHALAQAGLPQENLKIVRPGENFKEQFTSLLERNDGSLLVAVAPGEIKLIREELAARKIPPEKTGKILGFSPDGSPEAENSPFPICRFSTGELCKKAVECFIARMKNPDSPCVTHLIPGVIEDNGCSVS